MEETKEWIMVKSSKMEEKLQKSEMQTNLRLE